MSTYYTTGTETTALSLIKIDKGDTISEFVDKVNSNFENIAAHGGGPAGANGTNGKNGEDGTITQTIYALSDTMEIGQEYPSSNSSWGKIFESVPQVYGSVTWTGSPTGISSDHKNEYSWTRVKQGTNGYTYSNPVLYAHWGDNATSYKLTPSVSSIKVDYSGNVSTSKLTCSINNTLDGYNIYYNYDSDSKQAYTGGIEISTLSVAKSNSINFYYAQSANDTNPLDVVTVQIFKETGNTFSADLETKVNTNTSNITKLQGSIDSLSSTKADSTDVTTLSTQLSNKADKSTVTSLQTELNKKASQSDLDKLANTISGILSVDYLNNNGISLGSDTTTNDAVKISVKDFTVSTSSTKFNNIIVNETGEIYLNYNSYGSQPSYIQILDTNKGIELRNGNNALRINNDNGIQAYDVKNDKYISLLTKKILTTSDTTITISGKANTEYDMILFTSTSDTKLILSDEYTPVGYSVMIKRIYSGSQTVTAGSTCSLMRSYGYIPDSIINYVTAGICDGIKYDSPVLVRYTYLGYVNSHSLWLEEYLSSK